MKRLLIALAVILLLLTLAAPAVVGWLARRAQSALVEGNLASGPSIPQPLQERAGWLSSDSLWQLPVGVRPELLGHRMRHGPWLGADRFGWLSGRIELVGNGAGGNAVDWLDYQFGFDGTLVVGSELRTLQAPLRQHGRFQLDQGRLDLRHMSTASALDFSADGIEVITADSSVRLLGATLGAVSQPAQAIPELDLQLSVDQLVASQGLLEVLHAAPAALQAQLRAEEQGLKFDLTLNLDGLRWAQLSGSARAGLHLERIDLDAVQRLLATSQDQDTPPEQRTSRLIAALLAELPALAQRQPQLQLSQWQLDTELGRARLDARAQLQPPQRMTLGSGWLASMLSAEISLAVDDPLLQHLLSLDTPPDSSLAALRNALQETLRREWLRQENGLWRLRARYAESQWLIAEDAR